MIQLSHPYMATGKTIALTIWTFVCKVMFLLFNILSRFFITSLPRSKRLFVSQLQSPCSDFATAASLQSCPTLRPHKRQPTRLPRPWDSPGKNTGVGCHFLLQCMKVKEESEKVGLKLNIQKTKIMASGPITSWQIDGKTMEAMRDFILGGSKITAREGNGTPLQYSCLENPMDRGAW